MAEKKVVVLDIRTPKEYAAGHLAGAINIVLRDAYTLNGGYLTRSEQYFTNALALKSFHNLMRYNVARWGHSTRM